MYEVRVRSTAMLLLDSGFSVNAASKALGVSRSAISEWRDHGVQPKSDRRCPICDTAPIDIGAYALLFGYYLGDGCVSTYRGKHTLRVACDAS